MLKIKLFAVYLKNKELHASKLKENSHKKHQFYLHYYYKFSIVAIKVVNVL